MGGYFLKVPTIYLLGMSQANCFRTHNELTMYPLGILPFAPSDIGGVGGGVAVRMVSQTNLMLGLTRAWAINVHQDKYSSKRASSSTKVLDMGELGMGHRDAYTPDITSININNNHNCLTNVIT